MFIITRLSSPSLDLGLSSLHQSSLGAAYGVIKGTTLLVQA